MFNLQGSEIIVILLLALVVLGPEKLPDAIRRFSRTYTELKKMGSGFQSELKSALDEPMREMRETADRVRDIADPDSVSATSGRTGDAGRAAPAATAEPTGEAALVGDVDEDVPPGDVLDADDAHQEHPHDGAPGDVADDAHDEHQHDAGDVPHDGPGDVLDAGDGPHHDHEHEHEHDDRPPGTPAHGSQPADERPDVDDPVAHGEATTAHVDDPVAHAEPATAHVDDPDAHAEPATAHVDDPVAHGEATTAHVDDPHAHGEATTARAGRHRAVDFERDETASA